MAAPNPLPEYIYKIFPNTSPYQGVPIPIPSSWECPQTEVDARDGFVHLSTAAQVPVTARLFFADADALWILCVDAAAATGGGGGGVFRWVEGMPGCPHLYAAEDGRWVDLGIGNVRGEREVRRGEGQSWEEAFRVLDGWMVDE